VSRGRFTWEAFLEEALKCGMSAVEFWTATPRETYATMEAAAWRMEREQRRDVWLAWHVAALSRAKRLPALQRLMVGGKAKVLTGEEAEQRREEHEELRRRMGTRINADKRG